MIRATQSNNWPAVDRARRLGKLTVVVWFPDESAGYRSLGVNLANPAE